MSDHEEKSTKSILPNKNIKIFIFIIKFSEWQTIEIKQAF